MPLEDSRPWQNHHCTQHSNGTHWCHLGCNFPALTVWDLVGQNRCWYCVCMMKPSLGVNYTSRGLDLCFPADFRLPQRTDEVIQWSRCCLHYNPVVQQLSPAVSGWGLRFVQECLLMPPHHCESQSMTVKFKRVNSSALFLSSLTWFSSFTSSGDEPLWSSAYASH